jgi:hypothetical protein
MKTSAIAILMALSETPSMAGPYDNEAQRVSPVGEEGSAVTYICGGLYPMDTESGETKLEAAAKKAEDAAEGTDQWSMLDDKRMVITAHCLALEMDRLATDAQEDGRTHLAQKARKQVRRAKDVEDSIEGPAKQSAETELQQNAPKSYAQPDDSEATRFAAERAQRLAADAQRAAENEQYQKQLYDARIRNAEITESKPDDIHNGPVAIRPMRTAPNLMGKAPPQPKTLPPKTAPQTPAARPQTAIFGAQRRNLRCSFWPIGNDADKDCLAREFR